MWLSTSLVDTTHSAVQGPEASRQVSRGTPPVPGQELLHAECWLAEEHLLGSQMASTADVLLI